MPGLPAPPMRPGALAAMVAVQVGAALSALLLVHSPAQAAIACWIDAEHAQTADQRPATDLPEMPETRLHAVRPAPRMTARRAQAIAEQKSIFCAESMPDREPIDDRDIQNASRRPLVG